MPPVRRSLLFTPVNVRRFVEGVWRFAPDVVALDLEDAVAPEEKDAARAGVREAIGLAQRGGAEVALRINHDTPAEDCEAGVWPGVCTVILPKAETPEQVAVVDAQLGRLEAARGMAAGAVEIMPMVESAAGVRNAYAIASASPRVRAFGVLGEADLTADLGLSFADLHREDVLAYPRAEVGLAARALGATVNGRAWTPGPTTIADYGDREAMARGLRASWAAGCRSMFCVHPAQVELANRHLRPTAAEVTQCADALRAYTAARRQGEAYGVRQGVIIDGAMARAARETIAYALDCAARDAAKLLRRRETERALEAAAAGPRVEPPPPLSPSDEEPAPPSA